MSLLSYHELRQLQTDNVIEHSDPDHVNAASIDITLGPVILFEKWNPDFPKRTRGVGGGPGTQLLELKERDCMFTGRYDLSNMDNPSYYDLMPGEFILAQSRQVFNLPDWLSAEYKLKSSMARMGIDHANAGWCDAGWHGSVLTLELKNLSRYHAVRLRLGDKIGQMVFYKHAVVPSHASYATKGTYNNDQATTGAKPNA